MNVKPSQYTFKRGDIVRMTTGGPEMAVLRSRALTKQDTDEEDEIGEVFVTVMWISKEDELIEVRLPWQMFRLVRFAGQ